MLHFFRISPFPFKFSFRFSFRRTLFFGAALAFPAHLACITASDRPRDPEQLLMQAQAAFDQGYWDRAASLIDEGLAAGSDGDGAWRFRLIKSEMALWRLNGQEALASVDGDLPADAALAAQALLQRARAWFVLRNAEKAVDLLEESETLAVRTNAAAVLIQIKLRRGYLLIRSGNNNAAEALFKEAHQEAVEAGNLKLQAAAIGSRGTLLMGLAQWDRAASQFNTALEIAERAPDVPSSARILANIGECYFQLGAHEVALRHLREAVKLSARMRLPDQENSLGSIGNVLFSRKEFEQAIEHYQRALQLSQEDQWRFIWLSNIAATYIEARDWAAAELFNERALKLTDQLPDQSSLLYAQNNAAVIYLETGRRREAEKLFRETVKEAAGLDDPVPLWDGYAGLARLYSAQNRPALAEENFKKALSIVERVRSAINETEWQISFKGHWIHFAQDYVDFLMRRGEIEKALEVAESNRAVVLTGRQRQGRRPMRRSAADLQRIARSLDAVFLSYWVATAPRRSYGWLVSGDKISSFELPDGETVAKLVQGFRNSLEGFDPLMQESGDDGLLHEMLLKPIEGQIPPSAQLILVPDGPLNDLNFEAIAVPGSENRYWIEDVTLAVAPSLTVLGSDKALRRRDESLLLMGDPVPIDARYPKLAGAEKEIAALQGLFPSGSIKPITGHALTPDAYFSAKPGAYSFIHFAAHAEVNSESPLNSAVILSPAENGFKLYAREVAATPLQAHVVTLSACRSAGARTYAGAGLVGFAWAFLQAGAENVVAGLWDVDDRATKLLIESFYAELRKGSSAAQALRAAKLALIKSAGPYRKPLYWAPFQVFTRSSPFAAPLPSRQSRRQEAPRKNEPRLPATHRLPSIRGSGPGAGQSR